MCNQRRDRASSVDKAAVECAVLRYLMLNPLHRREIVESEALTNLALDCMKEVQSAARTQGIELRTELFDQTLAFSRGLGDFKPSMLQDLEAGKRLEYDAFNGLSCAYWIEPAEQAPINQVFHGTLRFLDNKLRQEASR